MVTTFTETANNVAFILSEANGQRSRENGVLKEGENLPAGAVLMDDGAGKLIEYTAGAVTDGGDDEAKGILLYATDATDADVAVSYLARDAEVNLKVLSFPDGTDEALNTVASLKLLNIICRD